MHRGYGHCSAHQDDARVQECHEAKLHHKVGGGRRRKPGKKIKYTVHLSISTIMDNLHTKEYGMYST